MILPDKRWRNSICRLYKENVKVVVVFLLLIPVLKLQTVLFVVRHMSYKTQLITITPRLKLKACMAITLFVICGGFVLAAVIAKNNYNWDKKEAITLRNDIEIQRNKLAEINKQKETVQSALSSQQKLLSEYN